MLKSMSLARRSRLIFLKLVTRLMSVVLQRVKVSRVLLRDTDFTEARWRMVLNSTDMPVLMVLVPILAVYLRARRCLDRWVLSK